MLSYLRFWTNTVEQSLKLSVLRPVPTTNGLCLCIHYTSLRENSRMSDKRDVSLLNIPFHSLLESLHSEGYTVILIRFTFSITHVNTCSLVFYKKVEMSVSNFAHQYCKSMPLVRRGLTSSFLLMLRRNK